MVNNSVYCSSRGPGFDSQHPHSSLQAPVTSIPGYLTVSSDQSEPQPCTWYMGIDAGKTLIHMK